MITYEVTYTFIIDENKLKKEVIKECELEEDDYTIEDSKYYLDDYATDELTYAPFTVLTRIVPTFKEG